jgi:hypothetical protein
MSQVTGPLLAIKMELPDHPDRHVGKLRYLKIGGYSKYFEVFVGKDFGDFSPAYERIDSLIISDPLTVYYSEDHISDKSTDDDLINRDTQFIDKKNQPYFVRGSKDKYGSCFFMSVGICLIVTLLILEKKGIIV